MDGRRRAKIIFIKKLTKVNKRNCNNFTIWHCFCQLMVNPPYAQYTYLVHNICCYSALNNRWRWPGALDAATTLLLLTAPVEGEVVAAAAAVVVVVVLLGEDGVEFADGDDDAAWEEEIVLPSCIFRCHNLLRTNTS